MNVELEINTLWGDGDSYGHPTVILGTASDFAELNALVGPILKDGYPLSDSCQNDVAVIYKSYFTTNETSVIFRLYGVIKKEN
jgi:hypothetical protein